MIREMAHRKVIILSTHILEEVEAVCTRAIIIARGKVVADDTPQNLKVRSAIHGTLRCTIRGAGKAELDSGFTHMEGVKAFELLEEDDKKTVFRLVPQEIADPPLEQVVRFCADRGYTLESFRVEEGRLDEVFRTITLSGHDEAGR